MAKKTFKIGEYVVGGIIQVETKVNHVTVSFLDYNSKKVILTQDFPISVDMMREIDWYISDNGTSYYADKVCTWIKDNVKFPESAKRFGMSGW